MDRRTVVKAPILALAAGCAHRQTGSSGLPLRYGVAAFDKADPWAEIGNLKGWGFDYAEPALSKAATLSDGDLAALKERVAKASSHVETMNWFFPGGDIKVTGPDVDQAKVRAYVERALGIAEHFGAKVIVFGSPGARSYPKDFPRDRAWEQLKDLLNLCADVIEQHRYHMVIGIEHLRKPETNIVNTVAEALQLAREVNRTPIRIIVDFYHLTFENEDPDVVLQGKDMIVHTQIADPKQRLYPKVDDDPRYRRFFENLRKIGYQGRISIEAIPKILSDDAPASLAFLKSVASASVGAP